MFSGEMPLETLAVTRIKSQDVQDLCSHRSEDHVALWCDCVMLLIKHLKATLRTSKCIASLSFEGFLT